MGVGLGSAPLVQKLEHHLNALLATIEVGHLVKHANPATLGTGSVITVDKKYQCIIELPGLLNRLHDAANFMVGHLYVGSKYLCLAGKQFFLIPT